MKPKKQYKERLVEDDLLINNQQTRSISVQGGEGKPFKDCLGTHKTKLTSPADIKKFYSWIILTNGILYYLNFANKEVNSDEINMCIDKQYFGELK